MNTSGVAARVVIMVQENHTTDHYFRSMRAFGANVATDGPISPNPPTDNPPHDRHAYYRWLTARQSGAPTPGATRPVRHHRGAALLRLPGRDWGVPGEPLFRVRHQLHPQPPAHCGRSVTDLAQPAPLRPVAAVGHAVAARPRRRARGDVEGLYRLVGVTPETPHAGPPVELPPLTPWGSPNSTETDRSSAVKRATTQSE